jgi:hypothetical protein
MRFSGTGICNRSDECSIFKMAGGANVRMSARITTECATQLQNPS